MDTSEVIDDILEHHGVKGMKWGVQRAITKSAAFKRFSKASEANVQRHFARKSARSTRKAEKQFSKKARSPQLTRQVGDKAIAHVNSKLPSINKKYEAAAKRGELLDTSSPAHTKYHAELHATFMEGARNALKEANVGTSPSGLKPVITSPGQFLMKIDLQETKNVSHADNSFIVVLEHDEQGLITGFHINDMTQSAIENILSHHGVKGQKWGVRRKATVGPQEVIVRDSRVPGSKRLVTKGGSGHPAVVEAVSARRVGQVSKKSGFKSLSNQELQAYTQRLQLEQNAKRLRFEDMSAGQKFVARLMGNTGKTSAQNAANSAVAAGGKKALKLAGLAAAA